MSTSVRPYHVIILSYLLTHLSARTWELPKCYKDDVRNFSTGENGQGRIEETGGDPTLPQKSRENTSIRSHKTVSIHFLLKCIPVKLLFLTLCLLCIPYGTLCILLSQNTQSAPIITYILILYDCYQSRFSAASHTYNWCIVLRGTICWNPDLC